MTTHLSDRAARAVVAALLLAVAPSRASRADGGSPNPISSADRMAGCLQAISAVDGSTMQMVDALDAQLRSLNEDVDRLLKQAESDGGPALAKEISHSHEAWEKYRDLECAISVREGSIGPIDDMTCRVVLTCGRRMELEDLTRALRE